MRWFALRTGPGRITRPRRGSGRILAVKWGLNPNSSSLGVDVTFLLFGAAALSMATPVIAALLRWRKPAMDVPGAGQATPGDHDEARSEHARPGVTADRSAG